MVIEKRVMRFLQKTTGFQAYGEEPETAAGTPDRYYVVEKPGGGEEQLVLKTPQISILCYAPSLEAAIDLCEAAKNAMSDFENESDVLSVELNTDHNYTNTAKKQYEHNNRLYTRASCNSGAGCCSTQGEGRSCFMRIR